MTRLRYDGKYGGLPPGIDGRSWTVVSHFVDAQGCDRFKSTFGLEGLREIGLLKGATNG